MPGVWTIWVGGAINLVFSAIAIAAVGSAVGLFLFLGGAAMGIEQGTTLKLLVYSSPVWAPLGAGMGIFTAARLMKGARSGAGDKSGA